MVQHKKMKLKKFIKYRFIFLKITSLMSKSSICSIFSKLTMKKETLNKTKKSTRNNLVFTFCVQTRQLELIIEKEMKIRRNEEEKKRKRDT